MEGGPVAPSLLMVSRLLTFIADRGTYDSGHSTTLRDLSMQLQLAAADGAGRSLLQKVCDLRDTLANMQPGDVRLYRGGWATQGEPQDISVKTKKNNKELTRSKTPARWWPCHHVVL